MKRTSELSPDTGRIEAFSDAVFAIAITIMVFQIQIPDSLVSTNDRAALQHFGALLATYSLSFVVVGILWANHHYLMLTLPKVDRTTIWLNNHVLFWVAMVPIVARFFGMHPTAPRAVAVYAFVIMMCTVALIVLRAHASRASHNEFHRALHRRVFKKAWFAIAMYAAAIPLAFVSIELAWVLLVILPALFFLPVVRPDRVGPSPPSRSTAE